VDDRLQEKQEFIEFEIQNVINAKTGRNIPIRLTVQDD
jgi:tetrahydromethanopterin S-methyltransferase subunit G